MNSSPYFGSKSTSPLLSIGGYQGRALAPGDMLAISKLDLFEEESEVSLPIHLRPNYPPHWDIDSMVGPYDEGYIVSEDVEMIYNTVWYVPCTEEVQRNTSLSAANYYVSGMFRIMPLEAEFALLDLLLGGQEKMAARADSTLAT